MINKNMRKSEALDKVITGLMKIPMPKDGKHVGISQYISEMREGFKLARMVQWADTPHELKEAYLKFENHVYKCI